MGGWNKNVLGRKKSKNLLAGVTSIRHSRVEIPGSLLFYPTHMLRYLFFYIFCMNNQN